MSCKNSTAPINVVHSTLAKCDMKCKLVVLGTPCTWEVMRSPTYLQFRPSRPTTATYAVYNDVKYALRSASMYSPSLHTWEGTRSRAELIIEMDPSESDGLPLSVCVAMVPGTGAEFSLESLVSSAADAIENASATPASAPAFNIMTTIPDSHYVAYSGVVPWNGCKQGNVIVFPLDRAIQLNGGPMSAVSQRLQAAEYPMHMAGPNAALSTSYPDRSQTVAGSEIYIDCRPTEEEGEALVPVPVSMHLPSFVHSNTLRVVGGIGAGLAIFASIWYGANKAASAVSKK